MQLGKAKKGAADFLDSLRAEGENMQDEGPRDAGAVAPRTAAPAAPSHPVSIVVEEKLRVVLSRNGGLEDMEVNGTVFLQVLLSIYPVARGLGGRKEGHSHIDTLNLNT